MTQYLCLDFETYGGVSLPVHGLDRYTSDPSFMPLIGASLLTDTKDVWAEEKQHYDFVHNHVADVHRLNEAIGDLDIVAHNAGFERRVLQVLGIDLPASRFIDSAVVARAVGAAGALEAAAPQLLSTDKLSSGKSLIQLFSVPTKYQEANGTNLFDPQVIVDHPDEWEEFKKYCMLDAKLGGGLVQEFLHRLSARELEYQAITMEMNSTGWPVDVASVEEMQRRYLENQEAALYEFKVTWNAPELNLNSLPQLKQWCYDRGVKATSFDEKHVESLLQRIRKRLADPALEPSKRVDYQGVEALLETKQILGGSSLSKLKVILNTVGEDGRLRDQYLHCGAGQTFRTTGRSVQMQNLKRLKTPAHMPSLMDFSVPWTNTEMAENLRQVFTSKRPGGKLIVGDFASVESRGLAYLAGEQWKLDAFAMGKDLYKVLAEKIFNVHYDDVLKDQRTVGKVGELSCGYGAGGGAVLEFAKNMGVEMSEGEASSLVSDWRGANPEIVGLWAELDAMLQSLVAGAASPLWHPVTDRLRIQMALTETPTTLLAQHRGAQSITLEVIDTRSNQVWLRRVFHGCYTRGRNVCYYKPSQRKTGDLWSSHYTDPKTKQVKFYSIYGGKLSGILTQSFCRELFFQSLSYTKSWVDRTPNVDLVGQFHDEIVLDWWPDKDGISLELATTRLERTMGDPGPITGFPLAAEIKHDYRYIK